MGFTPFRQYSSHVTAGKSVGINKKVLSLRIILWNINAGTHCSKVKVSDRILEWQTGKKQYAPDLWYRGHKNKAWLLSTFISYMELYFRALQLRECVLTLVSRCPTSAYKLSFCVEISCDVNFIHHPTGHCLTWGSCNCCNSFLFLSISWHTADKVSILL